MVMSRLLTVALFISLAGSAVHAQTAVGGQGDPFKDTSMLKPPPGVKVAIIEWEDLECPACAHAFPTVHAAGRRLELAGKGDHVAVANTTNLEDLHRVNIHVYT